MAQINLLSGQSHKTQLPWQQMMQILVKVLSGIAVVSLLAWAYLFFSTRATETKIFNTQNDIKQSSQKLVSLPERKEVIARQGQLKAYNTLVTNQTHWSTFFATKLAPVTLKSARYISLNAQNNGNLRFSVSVPTYSDLDKFLQVFDSDKLNKVFSEIKVVSLAKSQSGDKLDIRFDVTMKYNPEAARASQ